MTFIYGNLKVKRLLTVLIAGIMTVGCSNMNAQTAKSTEGQSDSTGVSSSAETSSASENDVDIVSALKINLGKSGIDAEVISAVPTQVEGIYWVTAKGIPSFFTDKAAKHVIQGQIVEIGSDEPKDITAELVAQDNKEKLAAVAKEDMIIYAADGDTKAVIYAFTDVTCPYCQKFHEEISELNKEGVEVRYLAWPRNEKAIPLMQSAWCSSDRKAAMDKLQSGKKVDMAVDCNSEVVQNHTDLGFALGVRGTPAVYTAEGEQLGGYLPAKAIVKALGL